MAQGKQTSALNIVMVRGDVCEYALTFVNSMLIGRHDFWRTRKWRYSSHFLLSNSKLTGIPLRVGARVHEVKDVEAILDVFQAHGHNEVSEPKAIILCNAISL